MNFLTGKKTYLVAAATVLGTVAAIATRNVDMATGVQTIITAVLAATLRNGVAKK